MRKIRLGKSGAHETGNNLNTIRAQNGGCADDFNAAIAETQSFGLPFAAAATAATIVTELAGSALILSGIYRWLGALWLAGFTLLATFVANRFWEMEPPARFMIENSFFERLGLVGAFLLVAWLDLRKRAGASIERSHA
jgi:uncharacterized membrane protein YphA (DoxX/SURF4 family)